MDALIVTDLDRLHRRADELAKFIAICRDSKLAKVATRQGDLDTGASTA